VFDEFDLNIFDALSIMNDKEIISEFIQVKQKEDGLHILVRGISWPHPYEPGSSWTVASVLPQTSSSQEVDFKIQEILGNKQYFQICQECGERNPCGWMHNDSICQSCAENNHGVVY
jgi:ribosomal protein L40E